MNPEQQRIAIAEACGWKREFDGNYEEPEWYWIPPNDPDGDSELPDYCNDLNACAEAEKVLTSLQFETFRWILWDLCKSPQVTEWNRAYLLATAAQRAEAFLRTIGKWVES